MLTKSIVTEILAEELTDVVNNLGLTDCEVRAIVNYGLAAWSFQRTCAKVNEARGEEKKMEAKPLTRQELANQINLLGAELYKLSKMYHEL